MAIFNYKEILFQTIILGIHVSSKNLFGDICKHYQPQGPGPCNKKSPL